MATPRGSKALALLGILLLAINLRPAITAVGPLISDVGTDLGLSASELGLLGALPVATFGIVSAFVQVLVRRFGVERVTAAAMIILTAATVLRSWPGPNANLWVGTLLLGAAIAVGNVTAPIFVKRSFPDSTARITSIYVSVLGFSAGLAAALAVPIAGLSSLGWRLALGIWAALSAIAAVYWGLNAAKAHAITGGSSTPLRHARVNLWRSPAAWWLSIYMGVQAGVFFIALTWLPTVEQHLGISAAASGWHMFVLQTAAVIGNLSAPRLMRIGGDERFAAILPGLVFAVSSAGFYFLPTLALLWVVVLGLGTGSAFVVSLSLIATRATSIAVAGQLSAMSQGAGYLITSLMLFVAGAAAGANVVYVLAVMGVAALGVMVVGTLTGRRALVS